MSARLLESGDSDTVEPIRFHRAIEIDGGSFDSEHVFIETVRPKGAGEERHCFALDRSEFIAAIKAEFGLVDPLEYALAASENWA